MELVLSPEWEGEASDETKEDDVQGGVDYICNERKASACLDRK